MTIDNSADRNRAVVPRWRSFLNTPTFETVPSPRFKDVQPIIRAQFSDLLTTWRQSRKPADFVDIMDAGIAAGDRSLAAEGAKKILEIQNEFQQRVVERAVHVIDNKPGYVSISRLPIDEENVELVHRKIANLKRSLTESPRNALSHIEIARLYTRLGQFVPAEHHLIVAISIAPNDRFVLRAMTRFFTMLGQSDQALKRLWSSDALTYDPWLQSAELSAAQLAKRGTKVAHKSGKSLIKDRKSNKETSELTSGWLSKLVEEGLSPRSAIRSLASVLVDPTENALAQSVWLVDHMGREFRKSFPKANFSDDAHEALALSLVEQGLYGEAEVPMRKWFLDQPFQIRACESLAYLYFTHLERYDDALAVVEQSLLVHPDMWGLLNSATIAACMARRYEAARKYLKQLERHQGNPEVMSFILAARGMIAFHEERFDEGFKLYIASASLSKKEGSVRRVIFAFIYLTEMMVRHRVADRSMFVEIFQSIKLAVKRLDAEDQRNAKQVIASREKIITRIVESEDFVDLLEIVSLSKFRNELIENLD